MQPAAQSQVVHHAVSRMTTRHASSLTAQDASQITISHQRHQATDSPCMHTLAGPITWLTVTLDTDRRRARTMFLIQALIVLVFKNEVKTLVS